MRCLRNRAAKGTPTDLCALPLCQAFVVGERGIMEELDCVGIASCGGPDDNGKALDGKALDIDPEVRCRPGSVGPGARCPSSIGVELQSAGAPPANQPQIGAVVCGVDPGLSYFKVAYASLCLRNNPGCLFVATNTDSRGHFIATQE